MAGAPELDWAESDGSGLTVGLNELVKQRLQY
jgi:hypothetical protein